MSSHPDDQASTPCSMPEQFLAQPEIEGGNVPTLQPPLEDDGKSMK